LAKTKRPPADIDPLKPLPMPQFGTPANGQQCGKCGLWFPFANFWRGKPRRGGPHITNGYKRTKTASKGALVNVCRACRDLK
jgi:hypothetical protein